MGTLEPLNHGVGRDPIGCKEAWVTATEERNLAAIRAYFNATNAGNLKAEINAFAEDTRNHGRPVGRAGVARVLRDIHGTFPDTHWTVEEIAAIGDQVVVRLTVSGTHLGVGRLPIMGGFLLGVASTGKHYSVQHIHWFTLRDGLIIEHRANRDDVGMMVQLGLLPAPPPFGTPPPNA